MIWNGDLLLLYKSCIAEENVDVGTQTANFWDL